MIRKITNDSAVNYAIEHLEAKILKRYGINTDEDFRFFAENLLFWFRDVSKTNEANTATQS